MPTFVRGDTAIHYEVHGTGYPLLLMAPGGMRSSIPFWDLAPFHPVREMAGLFQVIAMDHCRAAGESQDDGDVVRRSAPDLRRVLAGRYPKLAPLLERSAFAVNDEFASDDVVIGANAVVALLPPVSGG